MVYLTDSDTPGPCLAARLFKMLRRAFGGGRR